MSDARKPAPSDGDGQAATRPAPTPEVAAALARVEAARLEVTAALDDLSDATQSALDVPAKVRRHPVRTAALIGGAGFMLLGGPRRTARLLLRRVRPVTRDPYDGLLPSEIEEILRDSGVAGDPEVRRALNADFADYLRDKGKYGPPPGPATSFWRTFDRVAGPLGTVTGRLLVQRIMEADRARTETLEEASQARRARRSTR